MCLNVTSPASVLGRVLELLVGVHTRVLRMRGCLVHLYRPACRWLETVMCAAVNQCNTYNIACFHCFRCVDMPGGRRLLEHSAMPCCLGASGGTELYVLMNGKRTCGHHGCRD